MRQLIEERNLAKKELAELLDVSSSLISQLISGQRLPSEPFINRLGEKLTLDRQAVEKFKEAALYDREVARQQSKNKYRTGPLLTKILDRHNENHVTGKITSAELARQIRKDRQVVFDWTSGYQLPNGMAIERIAKALTQLGVSDADIKQLKIAHLKDSVDKLELVYLSRQQQAKLKNLIPDIFKKESE